jgi:hypothetical protein
VKWRPLLYDLDYDMRFDNAGRNVFGMYLTPAPTIDGGNVTVEMAIFGALMKNKGWRDKFVQRYVQLAETQFSPERILALYDGMVSRLKPEMAMHIERWHAPSSLAYWGLRVAKLRSALQKRQAVALRQMQRYFRVSSETMQSYIKKYSTRNTAS